MTSIISQVRQDLKAHSDPKTKASGQRFFKEEVKLYGVESATVIKIAKKHDKQIKLMDKTQVFDLCEELWKSGYMEESFVACHWSYIIHKKFQPKDFKVFKNWISRYVSNWASCDTFCNHTVGAFLQMYPEYLANLKNIAKSKNRWIKRAAAVSLIVPARKGKFLQDIFEIADILLEDEDDMVRKGYKKKRYGEVTPSYTFASPTT